CRVMPLATVKKLIELARAGATVIFLGSLPTDVPGFGELEKRRAELKEILKAINPERAGLELPPEQQYREVNVGKGKIRVGESVCPMLPGYLEPQEMVGHGIRFIHRWRPDGFDYFLVNGSEKAVDRWVKLNGMMRSALLLDPLSGDGGKAALVRTKSTDGLNTPVFRVYLQLQPGESRILRTYVKEDMDAKPWRYTKPDGEPVKLAGTWK